MLDGKYTALVSAKLALITWVTAQKTSVKEFRFLIFLRYTA